MLFWIFSLPLDGLSCRCHSISTHFQPLINNFPFSYSKVQTSSISKLTCPSMLGLTESHRRHSWLFLSLPSHSAMAPRTPSLCCIWIRRIGSRRGMEGCVCETSESVIWHQWSWVTDAHLFACSHGHFRGPATSPHLGTRNALPAGGLRPSTQFQASDECAGLAGRSLRQGCSKMIKFIYSEQCPLWPLGSSHAWLTLVEAWWW